MSAGIRLAAVLALMIGYGLIARVKTTVLTCSLRNDFEASDYVLKINIPPLGFRVIEVVGAIPPYLKILTLDDHQLVARARYPAPDWPDGANEKQFIIDRLSGRAEVVYVRHLLTNGYQPDKRPQDVFVPMADWTERGHCTQAGRAS